VATPTTAGAAVPSSVCVRRRDLQGAAPCVNILVSISLLPCSACVSSIGEGTLTVIAASHQIHWGVAAIPHPGPYFFFEVYLAIHPKTYRQAGLRRGTATSKSAKTGTTSSTPKAMYSASGGSYRRAFIRNTNRRRHEFTPSHNTSGCTLRLSQWYTRSRQSTRHGHRDRRRTEGLPVAACRRRRPRSAAHVDHAARVVLPENPVVRGR
jgi:hypothetical protein